MAVAEHVGSGVFGPQPLDPPDELTPADDLADKALRRVDRDSPLAVGGFDGVAYLDPLRLSEHHLTTAAGIRGTTPTNS